MPDTQRVIGPSSLFVDCVETVRGAFAPPDNAKRPEGLKTSACRNIEDNLKQSDALGFTEDKNPNSGAADPSDQLDHQPTTEDPTRLDELTPSIIRVLSDLCTVQDKRLGQLRDLSEKDLADIDAAVVYQSRMVSLVPDGFPVKARMLNSLGRLHSKRFEHLAETKDIDMAIAYYSKATSLIADGHPDRPAHLGNLGNSHMRRFVHLGEQANVDQAIDICNQVISMTPDDDPNKPVMLSNLGSAYSSRFDRLDDPADLDISITHLSRAISLAPDGHPHKPEILRNLGLSRSRRFRHFGELRDLDMAIAPQNQAATLTADGHPDNATVLDGLGDLHYTRFERLAQLEDIDAAIACHVQAALTTPDGDADKPRKLHSAGVAYCRRFEHLGQREDIEESIAYLTQAASLTPDGNMDKPSRMSDLGVSYYRRFEYLGDNGDLDIAITCHSHAVALASDDHPAKHKVMLHLGLSYGSRFDRLGTPEDLDLALTCHSQAVSLVPDAHPNKTALLSGLGNAYLRRFTSRGDLTDLDAAISCLNQAAVLAVEGSAKPGVLDNLGGAHLRRFDRLGELEDINRAISCFGEAVFLTPDGRPDKPGSISNLGVSYCERFENLGNLGDIDMAISCQGEAVSLTADGHPARPERLNCLGNSYHSRFKRLGELSDIETAISCQSQAASLIPDGHPNKPGILSSLGYSYDTRFSRFGRLEDIENAIAYHSTAVLLTPNDHPRKSGLLNNLGSSHLCRFERLKNFEDINAAVACHSQAVELTPDGHHQKHSSLNNLAESHRRRFECTGHAADLDISISYYDHAMLFTPLEHPSRLDILSNLGSSYTMRFLVAGDHEDVTRSIACYKEGALSRVGRPLLKLMTALQWARLSILWDSASALDAYQHVMTIIPQVIWLGSTADRRLESITSLGNAAMDAANAAILFRSFDLALEWLEQGRSIVWNQLLQLRAPVDELAVASPPLAEMLKQVAHDLEHASFPSYSHGDGPLNQEQVAQQHRRLAEKWETLVEEARLIPGLHDFLRPMKRSRLVEAAHSTTVATIIVHQISCDALIIRQGDSSVTHMKLTGLTFEKVAKAPAQLRRSLQRQGRSTRVVTTKPKEDATIGPTLKMLWEDLVKPILDLLGYVNMLPISDLPHISWCLTGPLAFLPLHAAGDYSRPGCALSDYAISSYTPNLGSLLACPADPSAFSGIAAVGQASTPGFDPLPGTKTELDRINLQAKEIMQFTRLEGDNATPSSVLAAMERHSWVHLACHASQDPKKPTASAFHLHNGPLSLSTIMQEQLKHADLAFLSACQTATGDFDLPEEAVHLAAGMIMAGYRRVVATMWSIHDIDAPLVADRFYAYMLDGKMPSTNKAAKALHYAVGCLREQCGAREFARWAPFIHIGS